jgi:hypothetical protein
MDSSRRDKAVSTVREAGYAMGGITRAARGGPKRPSSKAPMMPIAPPPATPATTMPDAAPTPGYADGGTTGGHRAWREKKEGKGFASGGSVQGRALSAGKKTYGKDIDPPAPGKDDDGDSSTSTKMSFRRGGKVR